jgi:ERCC4-type nuclease
LGKPEIQLLPAGDIHLDDIIIERKEPADLLASIADGRLFNQCAEMRIESAWCYLLIMGQLTWDIAGKIAGTGWNFRSVQGALLQCQELGVSVVHAQNDADLCTTLIWLANRKRTQHVFLPQRTGLAMPDDQRILASLPGVGRERALELLKERNLRDALLCLIDPECKVKGIGAKTKSNIRELLNLNSNQLLGVISDDK